MTYPFNTQRGVIARNAGPGRPALPSQARTLTPAALGPAARAHPRRIARFSYLDQAGDIVDAVHNIPDLPELVAACAAFSRGTLIATEDGPVAVEDLLPGDRIITRDNGPVPLRWCGATAINYRADAAQAASGSLRLLAHALGDQRPTTDLILHQSARVLVDHAACTLAIGKRAALVPVRALRDSDSVIELRPIGAVEFFNLAFDRHEIIFANGVETEGYHPGPRVCATIGGEVHHHLAHLFPYMSGHLDRFGPLSRPRLSDAEADALRLA